jgi:hypothetical protein
MIGEMYHMGLMAIIVIATLIILRSGAKDKTDEAKGAKK